MPPKLDVQSARHKADPLWAGRVRDDGAVIEGIDKFVSGPTFMTSWVELAAELGLDAGPANDIGFDLAACHTEPHRRYHTMEHITAVLRHLDNLHAATPTAKLAAFFHDAVYDPKRTDNEAQSAELAREVLGAVERPEADDVAAIVLATAKHELPADAPRETAAFLDADLAILAAQADVYDLYTQNVRAEYSHISNADFCSGRAAILKGFLLRDRLYFTTAGQAHFEAPARANLRREIAKLTSL